jgi:pyruvate dehydrogenase E1 component beta subunit
MTIQSSFRASPPLRYKGEVPEGEYTIPLGQADVKREGRDVTVVCTAMMVHKALEAAVELSREGIEIR